MIDKQFIEYLLLTRTNGDGKLDPLVITSWDPFSVESKIDGWTGYGLPARMILANAILDLLKKQ